jgi:hypothetical protein
MRLDEKDKVVGIAFVSAKMASEAEQESADKNGA